MDSVVGSRLRVAVICALVLLTMLALAGCGGSGTTSESPPASSVAVTSASPTETPLPTPNVAGTIAFTLYGEDGSGQADFDICVVDTDGTDFRELTGGDACESYPRWSPDGKKIVYMQGPLGDGNPQELWVMNADGSGQVQITDFATNPLSSRTPDWSPDGAKVVFSRWITDAPELAGIAVLNADGRHLRIVTRPERTAVDYWPQWAADGRIYFCRLKPEGGSSYVFRVKPDGTGLERVMKLGSVDQFLSYRLSPNAKLVAIQDAKTGRLEVLSVRGGGKRVTLIDPVADYLGEAAADVAWSPDQQAVAIAGLFDTGFTRLFVVNADGSGLSAVPGVDLARDPAWRPE